MYDFITIFLICGAVVAGDIFQEISVVKDVSVAKCRAHCLHEVRTFFTE